MPGIPKRASIRYNPVESPGTGINVGTGNAYLAGQDVYEWLDKVAERLVHLHAKHISVEHLSSLVK